MLGSNIVTISTFMVSPEKSKTSKVFKLIRENTFNMHYEHNWSLIE